LPADIGWGLMKAFHGKGYAVEASIRVKEYIMEEFQGGFRHATPPCGLVACLNEKNLASAAVARRVGLVRMGEVLYLRSEEKVPVYGLPGSVMNEGKRFEADPDFRINVFGYGEPAKRTMLLIFGQEELPENPYTPAEKVTSTKLT
jgi:hypothetical protein